MKIIFFVFGLFLTLTFFPQPTSANPACYCDSSCADWDDCCVSPGVCPSGQTCNGTNCVASSPSCTAGWLCSGDWKYYQWSDCSKTNWESCTYGCSGGSCKAAPCIPSWSCGEWSPLASSNWCGISFTQTRTCTDYNYCGTTSGKPAVSQTVAGTYCPSGQTCSGGTCVVVDTTAPATSITAPNSGSWQKANFSVSISDSDNVGGSGLSACYYGVYDGSGVWTVPWGTARVCNAAVTVSAGSSANCRTQGVDKCSIYAYSLDVAGNSSTASLRSFGIDYTFPGTPSINSPAANSSQSADFSVSVSNDNDAGGSGVSCYYHVLDSSASFTKSWESRTCNSSFTVTVGPSGDCRTAGGTCTVYAIAEDGAGNVKDSTRVFNIAKQCSALSFPAGTWQRVWYDYPAGNCLGDGPDWSGETFDNDWGSGVVAWGKNNYIQFASSRSIYFAAGKYRFSLGSDDGSILYLDGSPIISSWSNHSYPGSPPAADVDLTAGYHNLQLNYYENDGSARVSFNYYQLLSTKIDCALANCIFDKTSLECYGDRVGVGGYLKRADGLLLPSNTQVKLQMWNGSSYEDVTTVKTDSTGYAAAYWRPENTKYWDTKYYRLYYAGDSNYQPSQTIDYSLTLPRETCGQTDCNSEMVRRGYPSGVCAPNASGACSSYTNKDIIGEVGKCSLSAFFSDVAVWCSGCYNCPNTMPSDTVAVGSSCQVTVTGQGWDDSDGVTGGYHKFNAGGNWQEGVMDDNGCGGDNLKIRNTWDVYTNQINIRTDADRLGNTTHNVTAGFNISSNCKISEIGKVATGGGGSDPYNSAVSCSTSAAYKAKTNSGYTTYAFDLEYCGDGEQACGEVCDPTAPDQNNCKADCSGFSDAIKPTSQITGTDPVKPAFAFKGDFRVFVEDKDNAGGTGLKSDPYGCKYSVSSWNPTTDIWGVTVDWKSRSCNQPISLSTGPGNDCRGEKGSFCRLDIQSVDNANNPSVVTSDYYNVDWTPPFVQ